MQLGKTLGIFALSAAILTSGCQMGNQPQDVANADHDRPVAEMVVDGYAQSAKTAQSDTTTFYSPVHAKGFESIQQETDRAGINTMAPTEIAEFLDSPSVEGSVDSETSARNFSARFENGAGQSFEVICTNDGIGDGLIDGNGPITILDNGFSLQQTGPNRISSDWVQAGAKGDCHCLVAAEGLSMSQTARMTKSIQNFAPQQVNGAYIAQ